MSFPGWPDALLGVNPTVRINFFCISDQLNADYR
jgi:hypothetical protein